jgi:hypothetical protein
MHKNNAQIRTSSRTGSQDSSTLVENFRTLKKSKHKLLLLQLLENTSLLGQQDQTIPFLASVLFKIFVPHRKFYASALKTNALGK